MGRRVACIVLCTLVTGCGDGALEEVPTFLVAEAATQGTADTAAGPTLRGRARNRSQEPAAPSSPTRPEPQATVDEDGLITIPPGATWRATQSALRLSAERRRSIEGLAPEAPVLVEVPGVDGYVVIDATLPLHATGLSLRLDEPPGGLRAEASGHAWSAHYGCDARTLWRSARWSLSTWREALDRLAELVSVDEHIVRVRADPDMPAAEVLPFIAAATASDRRTVQVETFPRRRFDDAVCDSGNWLFLHQAGSGAWDDDVALGLCGGHRMRDVSLGVDPDSVENAGVTGLSLLAFLGAGYTNRGKHPFARSVQRGLRHLKRLQQPNGVFPASEGWDEATAHGLAALAMVEVYGMTGSPIWKGSAQRGIDALEGIWSRSSEDALSTVLTAMVLKSAEIINTDARKRGKPEPLRRSAVLRERVLRYARGMRCEAGGLRSTCRLFTLILLDEAWRQDATIREGAAEVMASLEKAGPRADPAHRWLGVLVCYQVGRKVWDLAKKRVVEKHIVETQRRDGHACCLKGSWDPPKRASLPGGRVTATATAALSLEVFYRYDRVFGSR
ncbi:MAG: hypothetical protein QNJ90_04605 [Planctomycetota bacterium]|nr:hypothetical protein [Planctomycetota bacterium]